MRIIPACKRCVERVFCIETETGDTLLAGLDLNQQFRELVIAGRAANQADVGRTVEDLLALLLCYATEDTKSLALVFAPELIQTVKNLLLRLVANAAGVVKQQIGFRGSFGLYIPAGQQRADHLFGIMHVHLTAECLDVELL